MIKYNLEEVDDVAKRLINSVTSKVLLINGEMGVGKTTLIKSIVKALGSQDDVSSPTFSLVNEYESRKECIYHFDLYRVNTIEELIAVLKTHQNQKVFILGGGSNMLLTKDIETLVIHLNLKGKELNVSKLNSGIYILKIQENGKTATRKLVIK